MGGSLLSTDGLAWGPCGVGWCLLTLPLWSLVEVAVLTQGFFVFT